MSATVALRAPNWSGRTLSGNWDVIWHHSLAHTGYALVSLALGVAVALPLSYWSVRHPRAYPVLLGFANVAYAIPSIALFILLAPWLGFTNDRPVVVAMAVYTLVILLRNVTEGVLAAPAHVVDAAAAVGYGSVRRFLVVELPMAAESVIAGLRLASVSTVSLISVGAVVGRGGLGRLFDDGFDRDIGVEVWAGIGAIVVLALVFDLVIVGIGRVLTPWRSARPAVTP